MRRKVFAAVEVEFEVEDPTHLMSYPEWIEAAKPDLRRLVEDAVRTGLKEQRADESPVAAVNFVKVIDWSASH